LATKNTKRHEKEIQQGFSTAALAQFRNGQMVLCFLWLSKKLRSGVIRRANGLATKNTKTHKKEFNKDFQLLSGTIFLQENFIMDLRGTQNEMGQYQSTL
jgi:hypothetical protein